MERGKIKYRGRAKQIKDFSGLRWKNITPTDIDGFVEFGNKVFIFIEFKCFGVELPFGQRLAIERLVDAVSLTGKSCIGIVAEHNNPIGEDINCEEAIVKEIRKDSQWNSSEKINLKKVIDIFLEEHAPEYVNNQIKC